MGLIKATLRYWLLSNLYFIIGVNDKLKQNCLHWYIKSWFFIVSSSLIICFITTLFSFITQPLWYSFLLKLLWMSFFTYHFYVLWKTQEKKRIHRHLWAPENLSERVFFSELIFRQACCAWHYGIMSGELYSWIF